MATVLIMGASRGIGRETVKCALAARHNVRALARAADRISASDPGLEKMSGDALDPELVTRAVSGVDVVVQTLGLRPSPDMICKPTHLFSDAKRILVAAMQEIGVKRLICVTGYGAGDSRNRQTCNSSPPPCRSGSRPPFTLLYNAAF